MTMIITDKMPIARVAFESISLSISDLFMSEIAVETPEFPRESKRKIWRIRNSFSYEYEKNL